MLTEHYNPWLLIGVASFGNTLGSVLNWVLGRFIARLEGQRWFPVSRQSLAPGRNVVPPLRTLVVAPLLGPFIGDPLTIAAGVLREPLPVFIVLVALAKDGPLCCRRGHRPRVGLTGGAS